MRTIGVVTVARSDFGLYRPILQAMKKTSGLRTQLIVGGMHLLPAFGRTIREIEAEGWPIRARVPVEITSDHPTAGGRAIAQGVDGFARAYERLRPDLLLLLGDRFEMFAAAVAAIPLRIPMAHVHGGESTEGAMDEAFRHAITKMSHLHFPATAFYARRLLQMGEEPWRILAAGSPAIDNLRAVAPLDVSEFRHEFGVDLENPTLLVTFHPVTLQPDRLGAQAKELLAALDHTQLQILVTAPSADPGGRYLLDLFERHQRRNPKVHLVQHLGSRGYATALQHARAMVGNSSSGIIESATFRLPVVNVGDRQRGRVRPSNVIDAPPRRASIRAAIRRALSPRFQKTLRRLRNPYGDGRSAPRIVGRLRRTPINDRLILKRFHDEAEHSWRA